MFITSPKTRRYGGPFVLPGYQSLSGTFSGAESNPWTSPMSSTFGIPSGTSLMSATQYSLSPPSTPTVQRQASPYVSGYGHLQQPNMLVLMFWVWTPTTTQSISYWEPSSWEESTSYNPPLLVGGQPNVGTFPSSQVSAQPHMSPPHLGMSANA